MVISSQLRQKFLLLLILCLSLSVVDAKLDVNCHVARVEKMTFVVQTYALVLTFVRTVIHQWTDK